jgi:predicted nucleic acid-binding Zn ribbon protein
MPTYLYSCLLNHGTREVVHSIMEDPKVLCTVCQNEMNRKPQATVVNFQGSGFYTTDKHDKH